MTEDSDAAGCAHRNVEDDGSCGECLIESVERESFAAGEAAMKARVIAWLRAPCPCSQPDCDARYEKIAASLEIAASLDAGACDEVKS